jgi:hypothetical protein
LVSPHTLFLFCPEDCGDSGDSRGHLPCPRNQPLVSRKNKGIEASGTAGTAKHRWP